MESSPEEEAPAAARAAVLKPSAALPFESAQVRGYDFNRGVDYRALLEAFGTTGFQATNFGRAVQQVNAMVRPGEGLPGSRGVWLFQAPTQYGRWKGGAPLGKEACPSLGWPNSWREVGPSQGGCFCAGNGTLPPSSDILVS